MSTPDPDFARAAADFRDGGWIAGLLGVLGSLLALLVSGEKFSGSWWARKLIAGGLTGIIMYFTLHGVTMNEMLKSIIMCTAGAFSTEWIEFFRSKITSSNVLRKRKTRRN